MNIIDILHDKFESALDTHPNATAGLNEMLEDMRGEPTLEQREAECMKAIHGDGIDEMSNDHG